MRGFVLGSSALILSAFSVHADFVTVTAFNNNTPATVSFDDGAGNSGTISTLLTQWNVSLSGGAPSTFLTFSIDLSHAASVGQTYPVNIRGDLATAFTNGSRLAYVFQTFGLQNLANDADQAAAVQIALWDLSLNNHNPTNFQLDADGSYSSGDPNVFKVSLAGNPEAAQIAGLVNQYLGASIGSTAQGQWLDASVSGAAPNHGPSLLDPGQPVPAPTSMILCVIGFSCLSGLGLPAFWRRAQFFLPTKSRRVLRRG